jgi:hypothetical protein
MPSTPTKSHRLPPDVRPLLFASLELLLDLLHLARSNSHLDYDSLVILAVINEAAMHPFMSGAHIRPDVMDVHQPPDEIRGAISRRAISDRSGLARETVRRKVDRLVGRGLVYEDAQGLRPVSRLADADVQLMVRNSRKAVERYIKRLQSLGIEMSAAE